jgi:hypothetical protein
MAGAAGQPERVQVRSKLRDEPTLSGAMDVVSGLDYLVATEVVRECSFKMKCRRECAALSGLGFPRFRLLF